MGVPTKREGLRFARFFMVLGSMSPLFVLWALRGTPIIDDRYLIGGCAALIVVPNAVLLLREWTARRHGELRRISIGAAEDHRSQLLVYLFAILLPFYSADMDSWRDIAAVGVAISFILVLFLHLNLHYLNVLFAVRHYRVFTIYPPAGPGNTEAWILLSKRTSIPPNSELNVYRISNTVYMEK